MSGKYGSLSYCERHQTQTGTKTAREIAFAAIFEFGFSFSAPAAIESMTAITCDHIEASVNGMNFSMSSETNVSVVTAAPIAPII